MEREYGSPARLVEAIKSRSPAAREWFRDWLRAPAARLMADVVS